MSATNKSLISVGKHARHHPTEAGAVHLTTGFWKHRHDQCRTVTLPHLLQLLEDPTGVGAKANFEVKAGLRQGQYYGTDWQDEFVHKWIEAASRMYSHQKDPALLATCEGLIDLMARAQDADGYLATQILRHKVRWASPHHHEVYVMGHAITAACVYHRATGRSGYLEIAERIAACLFEVFMPRPTRLAHFCINPSQVMALVDLYRATGNSKHLELARCFILMRGSAPPSRKRGGGDLNHAVSSDAASGLFVEDLPEAERPLPPTVGASPAGSDLNQTRIPLMKENEVAGHSVFWSYLYAGATDLCLETGDDSMLTVLKRLWRDVTGRKLYVTGGAAAVHRGFHTRPGKNPWAADEVHEAVGHPYDLLAFSAYNETCSQIGNFMWNDRLFRATGECEYVDLMEHTLYNSILSGIGLDGASWFYTNPLRWHGREHHLLTQDAFERFQPGEKNTCCPSNLVRTLAGFPDLIYALDDDGISVLFYAGSRYEGPLRSGESLTLEQETEYPWDGKVRFTLKRVPKRAFTLRLRIPEWCRGARVRINGVLRAKKPVGGRFMALRRIWEVGDEICLDLPMPVRVVVAHPKVESAVNQGAVARGPLLYCLEGVDLPPKVAIHRIHLPRKTGFHHRYEAKQLGGAVIIDYAAEVAPRQDWRETLYQPRSQSPWARRRVRLIPVFAWANRGIHPMTVWLPFS